MNILALFVLVMLLILLLWPLAGACPDRPGAVGSAVLALALLAVLTALVVALVVTGDRATTPEGGRADDGHDRTGARMPRRTWWPGRVRKPG